MKIKLEIEFDMPDNEMSKEELQQVIEDAYVRYAPLKHISDAMSWLSKSFEGTDEVKSSSRELVEYHEYWANILSEQNCKIIIDNE
jgi:hypothetical protein